MQGASHRHHLEETVLPRDCPGSQMLGPISHSELRVREATLCQHHAVCTAAWLEMCSCLPVFLNSSISLEGNGTARRWQPFCLMPITATTVGEAEQPWIKKLSSHSPSALWPGPTGSDKGLACSFAYKLDNVLIHFPRQNRKQLEF